MESKIKSIKKKIEESNHFQIQRESVLLIYQLLQNEKSTQIFDSSVILFLQLIYNPNTHVIETTIECIINLIKDKKLSREFVLNKLIESISSLERGNVGIIVKVIISLSIDIEYMSKIIKETNNKGYSIFPLNTLTKQHALSKPEIYDSFSMEIEELLSDSNIPSSLLDQRFEFLKPLISNLLLNINELPLETSLLHNSLIRIAHNISTLYQPILSHLSSLLYLYNNNNNNKNNKNNNNNNGSYQKIQYIRDLIDLIRFPPQSSNQLNQCNEFQKSILSIIYYLMNVFISGFNEKEISIRNMALTQIQDLIELSPISTTLLWNQSSLNSSSQNLNTPVLVVLLLYLPSSLVCFQKKILNILQSSIESLSSIDLKQILKSSNSNKQVILHTLRLSLSPIIRIISNSNQQQQQQEQEQLQNENLKKLLKQIESLIFTISTNIERNQEINSNQDIDDEDIEELIFNQSLPTLDIYLLDNFIPINLAWNLLMTNDSSRSSNGDDGGDYLKYEIIPSWLEIIKFNILNQKEIIEEQQEEEEEKEEKEKERKSLSNVNFSNEFLIYFLSPFLFYKFNQQNEIASEIRIKTIHLLPSICRNSIESISLIPLFFYSIQREESSNVILDLLQSLPDLANNKECLNSVVKVLSILEQQTKKQQQQQQQSSSSNNKSSSSSGSSIIMPSFLLRLYCKLLKSSPLIFTKIEELIYSIIKETSTTATTKLSTIEIENKISAAITIKEICEFDSNLGQELIQPLSQFLCKDNDPTILSISLEALSSLCENEILSFTSAWNVIKKNLGQEESFEQDKRSPMVLCSLLDFFSRGGVCDLRGEQNLEQKTIDIISDIIRRIWNLTFVKNINLQVDNNDDDHSNLNENNNINLKVQSKAFETLGNFINAPLLNLELFEKIKSKVPHLLIILSKYQKNQESIDENLIYLLNSLLKNELTEKRSLKTAHQNLKQTKSISIFSSGSSNNNCNKIFELLNNELINESRTGIKSGILGGLLWFNNDYDSQVTQQQQENNNNNNNNNEIKKRVESKKEILINFKLNNQILNESIEYLDNSRDLLTKLMITLGGWNKFMNQCFQALKKNDLMRQSLPSGTKLSIKETNEKVFNEIETMLLKNINETASTMVKSENSVYALISLAKTQSSICYSQMESIVNQLIQWITKPDEHFKNGGNYQLIQSASYLGLGILLPHLLQDSPLIKESINILEFAATSSTSKLDSSIKFNCYLSLAICSLKLSSTKHQNEKKRINLIIYNSFLNYFDNSNNDALNDDPTSSMIFGGLCLAIGYCSDSFEQLSMSTQLSKIYEIIEKKLIRNQQFSIENNLAHNLLLISFPSIIGSCFKLSLINSNEILNDLIPTIYLNQEKQQQQSIYQCIGYNNLIQILLSKGFTGFDLSMIQKLLISNNKIMNDVNNNNHSTNVIINSVISTSILIGSPILSQSSQVLFESSLESSVLNFINSNPNSRKEFQSLLNEIIISMSNLFKSPNTDSKLIRYISICLGSITLSTTSNNNNNGLSGGGEPENFDHLSNDLLIKALFNTLIDSTTSLTLNDLNLTTVESCLRILNQLNQNDSIKLPIVNWSTIIKRIYSKFRDNINIKKQCITFVSKNIKLSTLSIVMSEWLSLSNFNSESQSIQLKLIKSLPLVLNQLSPIRVNSIFDEIISNIILNDPFLIWNNVLNKLFNQNDENDQDDDDDDDQDDYNDNDYNNNNNNNNEILLNEIKEIISRFMILNVKNLPSPFIKENEQLSSDNMKLLKIASKSLVHLSKEQLQQCLVLLSGIVDIDSEAKIQYLYVLLLSNGNGPFGKVTLSNFYKIKSWCFSSTTAEQQSKVLSILPYILTKPLISNQNSFTFDSILNDIFDSITLTQRQHVIGLELLSQLISTQINNSIFEFNSFFNLYFNFDSNEIKYNEIKSICNTSISFRYLELLPYYLQVFYNGKLNNTINTTIKVSDFIGKLSSLLQNRSSVLGLKTKSIIFSSILTLNQLKFIDSSANSANDNQLQQLNIFNLYKILKSSPSNNSN
ncbi:hypothetical protein ACTFIW_010588 [Dictyostelium discoideum]